MKAGVEEEVGGTNLDYLHFPELGGSKNGLSLKQPSCLP